MENRCWEVRTCFKGKADKGKGKGKEGKEWGFKKIKNGREKMETKFL